MIDIGGQMLFACDECPAICGLDLRLALSEKYPDHGVQVGYCGCDKIDDKFYLGGYCEDAWTEYPQEKRGGRRKTGRAYRRSMKRQKLARKIDIALNCNTMAMDVGYSTSGLPDGDRWAAWGPGVDRSEMPVAYITRPKNSNRKKFLKRYANKLFRRTKIIGQGKSWHEKVFNVMWEPW